MTKKPFIFFIYQITLAVFINAQDGVSIGKNGEAPNPYSVLEVVANSKGILIPRVTSTQRLSINPDITANGLLVYDTDSNSFWYYNGTTWQEIGDATGGGNQQLSYDEVTNTLTLENGGTIDLSSLDQSAISVDDADADPTNEIELPDYSSSANMILRVRSDNSGVEWYSPSAAAETDPLYTAAPASGIAAGDITNWNTAFGWGNHSTAGYLTSYTETDPVFGASAANGITGTNITNWNTTFGWGDHSTAGYLTGYTETDPIYTAAPASGIAAGDITNWNTVFGWGNHSTAGYLTSYTETDPVFGASAANGITGTNITNWNTAFGWGDHSTVGYLVSEVDGSITNELEMPSSPVAGDLAYYDGTKWERVPKGTEGQVLTMESDTITWKTPAGAGDHYVGELYDGGLVIYVYFDPNDGQQHGLIVSVDNMDDGGLTHQYSNVLESIGCDHTHDGSSNTDAIIASTATSSAAEKVRTYYGPEWYLPSIRELQIIYDQTLLISKIFDNDGDANTDPMRGNSYWSSTEKDTNNAWYINIEDGTSYGFPVNGSKTSGCYVRAVKAF